jgi:hypothetical protein
MSPRGLVEEIYKFISFHSFDMGAVPLSRLLLILSYMYLELDGISKQSYLKVVSKFTFGLHESAALSPLIHNPGICTRFIHACELLQ